MGNNTRSVVKATVAAMLVLAGLTGEACVLITDAATRLAEDIVENAAELRRGRASERTFVHRPRSWPSGCDAGYTVTLQESLHHPKSGGALLVGCKGEPNFTAVGYSYSTTYHLNAVRVPAELSVEKEAGASLQIALRKHTGGVDLVGLE